jgi:hypothetical protein
MQRARETTNKNGGFAEVNQEISRLNKNSNRPLAFQIELQLDFMFMKIPRI